MAHELDTNTATGKAAMFSVKLTPWHNEGVILNDAPSFDAAMNLSGADYDVELRPLFAAAADGVVPTPMGRAVVRTDRGSVLSQDVLGIVSERYVPLQNRDAFGVLRPLVDSGVCKLETGGTLRGGADAWMLARFDIDDPVVREVFADEVVPFALVANNHSGDGKALVMETPVRVVCANTLGAAVRAQDAARTIAVPHRGDARVRVVDAAQQLFAGLVERYRTIAENYALMRETRLTVDQFTATVLDVAAPLPGDLGTVDADHLTVRGYDLARAAAERRRDALTNAWTGGDGHTGNLSAWEAYNGAVQVIDHDANLYRTRGSRVAALMGGRLLECKSRVLSAVMRECKEALRG